jgi:putative CocE/NonD family hydrolase
MRDGTRIAVDVHLPRTAHGPRLPTIVRQTRYMRSLAPRNAVSRMVGIARYFDMPAELRARFLRAGYAWVDLDVRGTGASRGCWRAPWFEDQRRDAWELVDWIVRQPWSNGRVGSLGISYDGTCADFLLADPHPAVRAIAPLFSLYDVFTDVAFPGGVHLAWFTATWAAFNRALDRNDPQNAMVIPIRLMTRAAAGNPHRAGAETLLAALGRVDEQRFHRLASSVIGLLIRGVADVESPGDGVPSAAVLAERERNLDVFAATSSIANRDDTGVHVEHPELTIDSFSPHAFRANQRASGAAIYSYSGWRDGAYPHAAIKRFGTVPNEGSRLTLGPWAHTGRLAVHGFATGALSRFDHAGELVDFFDEHLQGRRAGGDGRPVHWFTTGEERWHAGSTWPPSGLQTTTLHLSPATLALAPAPRAHADRYRIDPTAGTGERSRWRSLISIVAGDYPDRHSRDRALLIYESAPLSSSLEVTGHPIVTLFVSFTSTDDARVFAYLEDVAPGGHVFYVSEGQLAARHRAVARDTGVLTPGVQRSFESRDALGLHSDDVVQMRFDLLPFSHLFVVGHRVRLVVAAGDADHFALARPGDMHVHSGQQAPSRIELPTRGPASFRSE